MKILVLLLLLFSQKTFSQSAYQDSLAAFRQHYVQTHEVVKGDNRQALSFFPVSDAYRVEAQFTKATGSGWIAFPTSGTQTKLYKVYGTLTFTLNGETLHLQLYQSQNLLLNEAYKDYLFLPFTDVTTGTETYESGRYIDLSTKDLVNGKMLLDFNKAYNPYCAYVSGQYNCPLPPKENALPVAIRAGEKTYKAGH